MYTFEDDHETSSHYKRASYNAAEQPTIPDLDQTLLSSTPETSLVPAGAATKLTIPMPPEPTVNARRAAQAALCVVCLGVFLTALDQTVVVTALPQIINDLHIPITQLDHAAWIISAYLLGFVVAMPLMGRVSDIYGRRRIFLLCLLIFGLGSIGCGIAPRLAEALPLTFLGKLSIDTSSPGLIWLIAARVIQAIGGGAIVPVAMAVASDLYSFKKRGLALGIIGAVTEAGGAIGPLYGAFIVQRLGWQYIFYLNVPLVIALLVAAWFYIPRGIRLPEKIDWLGALFLALALTCLSLGLAQQGTSLGPVTGQSAAPQNNPLLLVLALVFLLAFILIERKVASPLIDLSLFKRLNFSASALVSLLVGAALIIAMADIPIYVDTVLQSSVLDSGLALLRLTVMLPLGALLGGWLSQRITSRITASIGLLFTGIGFYLMSRWPLQADWNLMTIATMTAGFGFGLVIAPISTTAINAVRQTQIGMSSAIVTALRMIGMILGLAILTSWALAYFRDLSLAYPSSSQATSGNPLTGYAHYLLQAAHTVYCTVFLISAFICFLAIIPALFLWGRSAPLSNSDTIDNIQIEDLPTLPIPGSVNRGTSTRQPAAKGRTTTTILAILLIISSGLAAYLLGTSLLNAHPSPTTGTSTTAARQIDLALNQKALTSVFVSRLGKQAQTLKNLRVTPTEHDGLLITFDLAINIGSMQRTLPVELDSSMYLDQKQNMQLNIQQVKRDGIDAGPVTAKSMQAALNQMLITAVMPAIHQQLKDTKILAIHTSKSIVCSKGAVMFVLQIEVTTIQGISAQSLPSPICFNDMLDFATLLHK